VVVVRIVVSGAWRDCRQVTRSCRHFVLFVVFRAFFDGCVRFLLPFHN
jgi:hypothetical protein